MLQNILDFVKESRMNLYDIAVIHDGIQEQAYCQPVNRCHNCYSVTKAVTATAIGILADRGLLSLDDGIMSVLKSEITGDYDKRWDAVRIRDALSHKMGLDRGIMDVDVDDTNDYGTEDYLKYILDHPPILPPGDRYVYSDVAHYLLGRVIDCVSGIPADAFINGEIFRPLHFRPAAFFKCPENHIIGATGLFSRAEDLVKIAALYKDYGVYDGKRIVSEEWVRTAEKEQFDIYPVDGTSFLGKGGMYGQMILYSREKNLAAAWIGFEDGAHTPHDRLFEYLENYSDEILI